MGFFCGKIPYFLTDFYAYVMLKLMKHFLKPTILKIVFFILLFLLVYFFISLSLAYWQIQQPSMHCVFENNHEICVPEGYNSWIEYILMAIGALFSYIIAAIVIKLMERGSK